MARVSLTRLELKRQRERLTRFERFLPALKLRQQQLQIMLQKTDAALAETQGRIREAERAFDAYGGVLGEFSGINVVALARPTERRVQTTNVAGVRVPVLDEVVFRDASYSLFGTPPWVDRALADLRELNRMRAEAAVLEERRALLRRELTRVVQRVNLFEKVKIPEAKQTIQRIRIHLGDQMAAAVGRSKIAKARLDSEGSTDGGEVPA
jgi:V/A-type H+-transporting ATPase subunit D